LRLEPFTDDHVNRLNALNADPEVMRYISGRPERLEETIGFVQ
jgi:ribosomal-protein-alanine N-acetyltransferase